MALSVCFAAKNNPHELRCLPDLPQHHFADDSIYHALEQYFLPSSSFIGIDPYDGAYLQDKDLQDLMAQVELASRELVTQPERWLVWTSWLASQGQDIKIELYANKPQVEITLRTLDQMAQRALENDLALLFMGD